MKLQEANPENDYKFRKEAEKFYTNFVKFLKDESNLDKLRVDDRQFHGYAVGAWEIDRKYKDLVIFIAPSKYLPNSAFGSNASGKKVIALNFLYADNKSPDAFKYIDTRISGAKNDVVHEFMHYLDSKRRKNIHTKNNSKKKLDSGDMEGYYNTPEEFNAFFQEGANSITNMAKNDIIPIEKKREWFSKSYKDFEKMALHLFDKGFLDNLNKKYERKFKQRLYQLYKFVNEKYIEKED